MCEKSRKEAKHNHNKKLMAQGEEESLKASTIEAAAMQSPDFLLHSRISPAHGEGSLALSTSEGASSLSSLLVINLLLNGFTFTFHCLFWENMEKHLFSC